MAEHWRAPPASNEPAGCGGFVAGGTLADVDVDADQNRVRMPIVPTIWFAVLDAPPDVLMNAW